MGRFGVVIDCDDLTWGRFRQKKTNKKNVWRIDLGTFQTRKKNNKKIKRP